ncbi:MAG: aldo/keto reductase [Bacilli bacterium]|jgi:diketogulonate reductase-like aldo/keto reductase|nr:aldo/keto reductase [Bacilli bacterium]
MKKVILSNGYEIPVIALGTWQATKEEGYNAVLYALQNGYSHIDTASIYNNEVEVGKAIKDSGRKREELFITSKVWNNVGTYDETIKAFNETLKKLDLDYLDLYLIHWPNPLKYRNCWKERNKDVWCALEDLYKKGKIKSIGVSNFNITHLKELERIWIVKPMVNQIRLCPGDTKDELVNYCKDNDIAIEAYSPFARGDLFDNEELMAIANSYHKSIAQVILRWCYQKEWVSLPKSVTPERISSNLEIFDFVLSKDEIKIIDQVNSEYDFDSNQTDEIDF